jgi:hypothetical protein
MGAKRYPEGERELLVSSNTDGHGGKAQQADEDPHPYNGAQAHAVYRRAPIPPLKVMTKFEQMGSEHWPDEAKNRRRSVHDVAAQLALGFAIVARRLAAVRQDVHVGEQLLGLVSNL